MSFFSNLLAVDDAAVDSIIVGGSLAMMAMIVFQAWQMAHDPTLFSALSFSGGTATILGAVGAGKRLRDGVGSEPQPH